METSITLGNYFFDSPIDLSNTSIKDLMCFINGIKWLTRTNSTLFLDWYSGTLRVTLGLIGLSESKQIWITHKPNLSYIHTIEFVKIENLKVISNIYFMFNEQNSSIVNIINIIS